MQSDIIYYNLNMVCKKKSDSEPDVEARFDESRDIIFITNAQTYNFSIIRFTLESNNIPVHIPKIKLGQADINMTNYSMQMIYKNGGTITPSLPVNLEYLCNNKFLNNFVAPPTTQQQDDPYYYIYNIQDVVDMFNEASNRCMTNLISSQAGLSCEAPKMKYNGNNTFSIYFDDLFNANVALYLNNDLMGLFSNFSYKYVNNNGINNKIIVNNKLTNTTTINTINYTIETQSYPSFQNWSPVQSIVFNSSIGVNMEYVSEPQILNNSSVFGLSTNKVENVITDIILPIDNPSDYNSFVMYNANVYREANLKVNDIRNIGMSIYWKNKMGKNYPIMLSDGNNVTVKIKFERIAK